MIAEGRQYTLFKLNLIVIRIETRIRESREPHTGGALSIVGAHDLYDSVVGKVWMFSAEFARVLQRLKGPVMLECVDRF